MSQSYIFVPKHFFLQCSAKPDEPLAQALERILGKTLHDKTKSKLEAGEEVRMINPQDFTD